MNNKKIMLLVLWSWVIAIFVAYIIQFLDFIEPILNILGVK
tara:strand:+ start:239 stop:361 length:123 start_codon:yes stop_codon:yes gene_type:complete